MRTYNKMRKPYHLLTEVQKVLCRAAKTRWRDRNRAKQRALTKAWQQKNRDRINKQYRDRYAANPELYRAKLKSKRERWARNIARRSSDREQRRVQPQKECFTSG